METRKVYQDLAKRLDSFPQGYPATNSGKELEILAYLFSPEEARLASHLYLTFQPLDELTEELGLTKKEGRELVKSMSAKGLIYLKRTSRGIEVLMLPFIVGFYENQRDRMDEAFANLFEDYYREAAFDLLSVEPQFQRVIPVNETIRSGIEILPEESVSDLLSGKKAWAVVDCICRKQQALLGKGCEHPLKVCLVMSDMPDVFTSQPGMEVLDLEGALGILDQAAKAGLVHTISNQKKDISYVCNCCTCSCGLLRGISEAHIANVVARSAYFASVDEEQCTACGNCEDLCQFDAITVTGMAEINHDICVGCGVCAKSCPSQAISLSRRDEADVLDIPDSLSDWLEQRAAARNLIK